jgi:hypothetical protein
MLLPFELAVFARALERLSQSLMEPSGRWYIAMIISIPSSLLLCFKALSQSGVQLYILHLLCAMIYYTLVRTNSNAKLHSALSILSYVAFSVQTKLVLCSLLPSDAG